MNETLTILKEELEKVAGIWLADSEEFAVLNPKAAVIFSTNAQILAGLAKAIENTLQRTSPVPPPDAPAN